MRIYVDMDGVLVDFNAGIENLSPEHKKEYAGREDEAPNIFSLMPPMPGALKSFRTLAKDHDVFILTTAPWDNPPAWAEKVRWVQENLGDVASKRVIMTHHKYLLRGDILIDDRRKRGAGAFHGRHLHFGPKGDYADWDAVMEEIRGII